MVIQLVLFVACLGVSYCLGHANGKQVGWKLARQFPCIRHLANADL